MGALMFIYTERKRTGKRFLVVHYSHITDCFWLFAPTFWEVAGTYEWYFVALRKQVEWWGFFSLIFGATECEH